MTYNIELGELSHRDALERVDWSRVSDHACVELFDALAQMVRLESEIAEDEEPVYHEDIIMKLSQQMLNLTLDRNENGLDKLMCDTTYLYHDVASAAVSTLHALADDDTDPIGFWWFGAALVNCKYDEIISDFFVSAYSVIFEHQVIKENS